MIKSQESGRYQLSVTYLRGVLYSTNFLFSFPSPAILFIHTIHILESYIQKEKGLHPLLSKCNRTFVRVLVTIISHFPATVNTTPHIPLFELSIISLPNIIHFQELTSTISSLIIRLKHYSDRT